MEKREISVEAGSGKAKEQEEGMNKRDRRIGGSKWEGGGVM